MISIFFIKQPKNSIYYITNISNFLFTQLIQFMIKLYFKYKTLNKLTKKFQLLFLYNQNFRKSLTSNIKKYQNNQKNKKMPVMQQDPAFRKLYQKSFILQKYDDIEAPLVSRIPTIKNHLFTTFFLSSFVHFLIYPFDTIKNRLISYNKITDIAKFQLNKTKNQTLYLGIFRGYFSVLIGNAVYLAIGRQNFVNGAVVQGILKTWIDMMKISKQMANKNADLQIMKKTFGVATVAAILRDTIYRGSFTLLFNKLNAKYLQGTKFDQQKRMNNMFFSTILATVISHPLEVIFTKIASQRQLKYTNLFKTPYQIIKEQGFGKLTTSGLWARIVYNLLSTSVMFNFYEKTLEVSLEVI